MISKTVLMICAVISVTDGDTFRADCDGHVERVRIADIDAPEMRARCPAEGIAARAAREALQELIGQQSVTLTPVNYDRYGRLVAGVQVGGIDIGEELIEEGFARSWRHDSQGKALEPRPKWCE